MKKSEVLFVTDTNRDSSGYVECNVYAKGGKNIPGFEYFKKVASSNNFRTLDLQPYLRTDYLENKERFETV